MHVWLDVGLVEQVACEVNYALSFTWSLIWLAIRLRLALTIVPVHDGWIAFNLESASKLLLFSSIDLGELDLSLELGSGLIPLWLELLAVSTPWSVELNHPDVLGAEDFLIEGRVSQHDDILIACSTTT